MFSRIYNRNIDGSNQGSVKSNRFRITLRDRMNSKESLNLPVPESGSIVNHQEREDSLLLRRSSTIGRVIQNGSQQVFYPVNPNNKFARQAMRGRYNSNMIQSSNSNSHQKSSQKFMGTRSSSNEQGSVYSLRSNSDLASNTSPSTGLVGVQHFVVHGDRSKSRVSSIPIERVQAEKLSSSESQIGEIGDSENEGMNSNRNRAGLPLELYSLSEDSVRKVSPELSLGREDSVKGAHQESKKDRILARSILLDTQKLPDLVILPTISKGDHYESRSLSCGYDRSIGQLIPRLDKSAFYFVRFNLLLHLAAIVIQCYYRRYLCKKYLHFRKLGPIKLLNSSALQIQACWRSFLTRFGASLRGDVFPDRSGYGWSALHEKHLCEIVQKRNISAKCIQKYWRGVYIQNVNLEREILANSIFSARSLARETIQRFIMGHLVRRTLDSRYRLVPIKWGWSVEEISRIFILQRTKNGWSEPKRMWFSPGENFYKYNLFLPNGIHFIVFKVYYKGTEKDREFEILCNSSLETTPNDEFQFVNSIGVHANNYPISALKHMRDVISSIHISRATSMEDIRSNASNEVVEDDLSYIALSPSYKGTLDMEYSETNYTSSPYKEDLEALRNDLIKTPSTDVGYSPEIHHFIH
ncbi:hypothetical protein OJ253_830 [Cryptosporidium canis]|uniref:IQ calmodulin-binding motif family protein n=1 Tax=Cryptosporidium canis TaxID=195482 RepID=A0A9D5HYC4_9CRYT|nr:hypothetical protein OJ253_830 [Cryptosporidium canis]